MFWLGTRTADAAVFRPGGLMPVAGAASPGPDADTLVTQGGLLAEVVVGPVARPDNLLRYRVLSPWPVGLSVVQEPDGTFRLLLRQGDRSMAVSLATDLGQTTESIHLIYSWDAPSRRGEFSVHAPAVPDPFPLALRELDRMVTEPSLCRVAAGLTFLAVASGPVVAGPMPSVGAGGQVSVPGGLARIEDLRRGDPVQTRSGRVAMVSWVGHTDLPALGRFAPHILHRPYLGLTQDLVISPLTRLCLSGPEIEYLFGEEEVSAAVGQLVRAPTMEPLPAPAPVHRWYQVHLDEPGAICVNNIWIEALETAPYTLFSDHARWSVLSSGRPDLSPVTLASSLPRLRPFEAVVLQAARYS